MELELNFSILPRFRNASFGKEKEEKEITGWRRWSQHYNGNRSVSLDFLFLKCKVLFILFTCHIAVKATYIKWWWRWKISSLFLHSLCQLWKNRETGDDKHWQAYVRSIRSVDIYRILKSPHIPTDSNGKTSTCWLHR